ncbi:MAG: heavy metal translocating P-type ATPase, partial [Minisyncoccota bacterium]
TIAFVGLIPVAKSALISLRSKRISVDLLATIALFFSLIAHEWVSVLFINMMLTSARILDLYAKRRVHDSLQSLAKLKPLFACVVHDQKNIDVPISEVQRGDLVLVNLGEQIPVDGRVEKGVATVDQSSLTGESLPALLKEGDAVLSATVVVSGNITVRAEKVGPETTFERMIKLVESSQSAKSRIKTVAERFASWYIGIMLVVAIILYATTGDTKLVLAVVLVVCADDIAIAIPLAYVAAIGTAARRGIIIKSADFLEQAAKITTLIVDKTGTLTMGRLAIKNVHVWGNITLPQTIEMSAALSSKSTHPIAKAIIRYTKDNNIPYDNSVEITEVEGRGVMGVYKGNKIIIGRREFIHEQGIPIDTEVEQAISEAGMRGNNTTIIAQNDKIIGLLALADEVRGGVAETIASLEKSGVKETIMLTGDNEGAAKSVAQYTGINTYYPKLFPKDKISVLEKYLGRGRIVAMVGDGVNDAAVLTRSDIGIAMGGIGSDAAIDSADIVLMKDDFPKLLELRSIARKVLAVSHQNFTIWAFINIIGLYFVFTGLLDPSGAAAYNFITDFIPISNALRLYRYQ